jgi:hypothetical protein
MWPIYIESGSLKVQITAKLSQGKFESRFPDSVDAGMIQHTEDMKLSFYLPVPLNEGCIVTVELPIEYETTEIAYVGTL